MQELSPLVLRHCYGIAVGELEIAGVQMEQDEPVCVGADPRRDHRILLRDHHYRHSPVEYDVPAVHYELREPWIILCLLDRANAIIEHQERVSVRFLLITLRHLLELCPLHLHVLLFLILSPFILGLSLFLLHAHAHFCASECITQQESAPVVVDHERFPLLGILHWFLLLLAGLIAEDEL